MGLSLREVPPDRPSVGDRGDRRARTAIERAGRRGEDRDGQHGPGPGPCPGGRTGGGGAAEAAAGGAEATADAWRSAAQHAAEGTQPPADLHGAADYRRHLARVLTAKALAVASGA